MMKPAVILFALLLLLLLTGGIPVSGGVHAYGVFYSPVFILLLALLSGLSVWCCVRRGFLLKQAGFYFAHLGVAVILAGAFAGYLAGEKGMLQLSLRSRQFAGGIQRPDQSRVAFGFEVAAEEFKVEFYPPVYQLYRPLPPEKIRSGQMPFEAAGEFSPDGRTEWDLGEYGRFEVASLWNELEQQWIPRYPLGDGAMLFLAGRTPRFYGVTLRIRDGEQEKKLPVSINHPAGYRGWRFYLMSYDQAAQRTVQLSARRDPGRGAVIAGIWMLIAGTCLLCFRREGGVQ